MSLTNDQLEAGLRAVAQAIGPIAIERMNLAIDAARVTGPGNDDLITLIDRAIQALDSSTLSASDRRSLIIDLSVQARLMRLQR